MSPKIPQAAIRLSDQLKFPKFLRFELLRIQENI